MPKQSLTLTDWSGGQNFRADPHDVQNMKSVAEANCVYFDNFGAISCFSLTNASLDFNDHEANVSGGIYGDYVDLDRGIGHETSTNTDGLEVAIANISSGDSDELSWEDGMYNFKYTVCKDLGNGVIEEGPLQSFSTDSASPEGTDGALNVDMSGNTRATFTFSESGSDFPSYMDAGYATAFSICGRVYYSRVAGQGSVTQPGYIHLCDLIYTANSSTNRVQPRAIGGTGDPNSAVISIEEPPTSASFEMNAGYPSDVGILDVAASDGIFSEVEAKVKLGMVTYVAKSGYIYRSAPGQPDIFPTDNWIDMTTYGTSTPCKAMYGMGNLLCYFTSSDLILFDVSNDTIVKTMKGYGIDKSTHSAKMRDGIVWRTAVETYINSTEFYYLDQSGLKNLTKNRHVLGSIEQDIQIGYQEGVEWLRWTTHDLSELGGMVRYEFYSFKTDTLFNATLEFDQSFTNSVDLGWFTANDVSRFKRIYKITMTGIGLLGTTLTLTDSDYNDIANTKSGDEGETGATYLEWTPDSSLKTKRLKIAFDPVSSNFNGQIETIGVVYRMMNKF